MALELKEKVADSVKATPPAEKAARLEERRVTQKNHHHLSTERSDVYKIPYREVVVVVVLLGASLNTSEGGSLNALGIGGGTFCP